MIKNNFLKLLVFLLFIKPNITYSDYHDWYFKCSLTDVFVFDGGKNITKDYRKIDPKEMTKNWAEEKLVVEITKSKKVNLLYLKTSKKFSTWSTKTVLNYKNKREWIALDNHGHMSMKYGNFTYLHLQTKKSDSGKYSRHLGLYHFNCADAYSNFLYE